MDLTLSPSETAFRDELRGWLEQTIPASRRRQATRTRASSSRAQLAAQAARGRMGRHLVAEGVRRPRRDADRAGDLLRGDGAGRRAARGERDRARDGRPRRDHARHRGAEAALPGADPVRRGDLVPGLLGAGGRLGPRVAEDARRQVATASGWSPGRRCGPRSRTSPSGACSSRAPTRTRRSTRA